MRMAKRSRRLEHDSRRLNRKRGFPGQGISDSRCWLGVGASIDGETLFDVSSGSGGQLGWRGSLMPGDSGVVRRERGERGEVVAAFPRVQQRDGIQDGRLAAT